MGKYIQRQLENSNLVKTKIITTLSQITWLKFLLVSSVTVLDQRSVTTYSILLSTFKHKIS